jgi:hypothetical protein
MKQRRSVNEPSVIIARVDATANNGEYFGFLSVSHHISPSDGTQEWLLSLR